MDTKSFGETMSLTKENIAAMLAIIGKEEKNTTSPTAIVMLTGLKDNLKILFDKLCRKELDFCMIRMGRSIQMDDNCFEYAKIEKIPGVTKTMALANFMNGIQQYAGAKHIEIISSEETVAHMLLIMMMRGQRGIFRNNDLSGNKKGMDANISTQEVHDRASEQTYYQVKAHVNFGNWFLRRWEPYTAIGLDLRDFIKNNV